MLVAKFSNDSSVFSIHRVLISSTVLLTVIFHMEINKIFEKYAFWVDQKVQLDKRWFQSKPFLATLSFLAERVHTRRPTLWVSRQ